MRKHLSKDITFGLDYNSHDLGLQLEIELQLPLKNKSKGFGWGLSLRFLPINIWIQRWQKYL